MKYEKSETSIRCYYEINIYIIYIYRFTDQIDRYFKKTLDDEQLYSAL